MSEFSILRDIKHILRNCALDLIDTETLLQLFFDWTAIVDTKTVGEVVYHIRRLCYMLHVERYKRLSVVPRRNRSRKAESFTE